MNHREVGQAQEYRTPVLPGKGHPLTRQELPQQVKRIALHERIPGIAGLWGNVATGDVEARPLVAASRAACAGKKV
jgi:hypothetical protein